jgi:hypothetical protein
VLVFLLQIRFVKIILSSSIIFFVKFIPFVLRFWCVENLLLSERYNNVYFLLFHNSNKQARRFGLPFFVRYIFAFMSQT